MNFLIKFSNEDVKKAIKILKDGISFDKIHSNHLKLGSDIFIDLFAKLITSFVIHSYIPMDLLKGIITPLVKDKFGDLSLSSNYRPVMSSSVLLKLFEYCLLSKIDPYVELNDRQHGFRKKYSTSTACYCLKETIMFYTNANSDVHTCFIDISKAFDSVNHCILIDKLSELGIPNCLINLIRYWYDNQYVKVKYGSTLSEEWRISNGVRQGGVLSGLFFAIYINSLIEKVSKVNSSCMLGIARSNIIAYADDVVLMAPSAKSLQILIDVAYSQAVDLDLF